MRDVVALRKILAIALLGLRGRAKAETIARQDKSTRHHGARGSLSAQGLTRHAFFDASCRGFWRTALALEKRRAVYAGIRPTSVSALRRDVQNARVFVAPRYVTGAEVETVPPKAAMHAIAAVARAPANWC
jgi:hypothetical protein